MRYTLRTKSIIPAVMVMAMLLLMLFPAQVFAEGEEPADDGGAPIVETAPTETDVPATEEPVTEEPVIEETTTPDEGSDGVVEPDPLLPEEEALPDPEVIVVEEADLSEVVQVLAASDVVIVD